MVGSQSRSKDLVMGEKLSPTSIIFFTRNPLFVDSQLLFLGIHDQATLTQESMSSFYSAVACI